MNATILDPEIYSLAKRWADQTYDKPSAYKSGAIVKKYKELGGRYGGTQKNKTALGPLTTTDIDPKDLKYKIAQKQRIKGSRNLSPFRKK